jgi:hypothetical protein
MSMRGLRALEDGFFTPSLWWLMFRRACALESSRHDDIAFTVSLLLGVVPASNEELS